ncbi:Mycinamicin III 3''-O-methyltransferase [Candidatus Protofrankia californiensis]|uniref:Mycinamicin III 3''-O-methyltransferase n=1 Tax=Candidatus Protofrankia californiensis TaxID=1839754 RepID=A0A1C3NXL1_9ACTN|nr:Mycinamicin III 3''-O-methyltransferase [Candidatus Protofrankia californiensis]
MTVSTNQNETIRTTSEDLRERYIDLLKQVLSFSLWDGQDGTVWRGRKGTQLLQRLLEHRNLSVTRMVSPEVRRNGQDWPRLAHTMVGAKRLDNLQECMEVILRDQVPGDLIETGVWRGGSCILMRGILAAHGVTDRRVWVADSFSGLPEPEPELYPADRGDRHHTVTDLAVSLAEVKENFRRYGLLDDQVIFLPGWFSDTLPGAPIERLALMRLDGDMYSSTIEALTTLYPKLSEGGFCIIDDFGAVEGCRRAVEDFRSAKKIDAPLKRIDACGAFWRR